MQGAGSVVGHAGDDHDCPLARFLSEGCDERVVVGLTGCVVIVWPRIHADLPDWAREFVHRVDEEDDEAVTRERALAILEAVP